LHNTHIQHTPNEGGGEVLLLYPPCMLQNIEGPMRDYNKRVDFELNSSMLRGVSCNFNDEEHEEVVLQP
jgi:hypothetical protein